MANSLTVKSYLTRDGKENPEIRRFPLEKPASIFVQVDTYRALVNKLVDLYPFLTRSNFTLHWKDEDGDLIQFSSMDEMKEANLFSQDVLKIYIFCKGSEEFEVLGKTSAIDKPETTEHHSSPWWHRKKHFKKGHGFGSYGLWPHNPPFGPHFRPFGPHHHGPHGHGHGPHGLGPHGPGPHGHGPHGHGPHGYGFGPYPGHHEFGFSGPMINPHGCQFGLDQDYCIAGEDPWASPCGQDPNCSDLDGTSIPLCRQISPEFRCYAKQMIKTWHAERRGKDVANKKQKPVPANMSQEVVQFLQKFLTDYHSLLVDKPPHQVSMEMMDGIIKNELPSGLEVKNLVWFSHFLVRWHHKHAKKCDAMGAWSSTESSSSSTSGDEDGPCGASQAHHGPLFSMCKRRRFRKMAKKLRKMGAWQMGPGGRMCGRKHWRHFGPHAWMMMYGMNEEGSCQQKKVKDDEVIAVDSTDSEANFENQITEAVEKMKAMGFHDNDGWLTSLLKNTKGDVGEALEVIVAKGGPE